MAQPVLCLSRYYIRPNTVKNDNTTATTPGSLHTDRTDRPTPSLCSLRPVAVGLFIHEAVPWTSIDAVAPTLAPYVLRWVDVVLALIVRRFAFMKVLLLEAKSCSIAKE